MKTSITYYPNQNKKSRKTGIVPLYARICSKGLKAEERLNAEVDDKELLKWDPMSMRFLDRTLMANKLLNVFDQRFGNFLLMNATSLSKFHLRAILDYVLGREEEKKKEVKIIDYVDQYFTKVILANKQLSAGTVRNYTKSLNHFKAYLKVAGKESIVLSCMDNILCIEFKQYLENSSREGGIGGMTEVSASSILKNFTPIFNRAVDEGLLEKNPFQILKLRHKSPRRDRLSIGHVKALHHLDLSRFPAQRA
jgi:hypothetical protein